MKALSNGRRRKFIVDKQFQWRTTLIGVLYIIAVGVFVGFPFAYLMRATNGLLAGYPADLTNSFKSIQRLTLASGFFFLLSIAVAWIYFSLRRSHRVAGPVVNIARMIDEFAKGNYSVRVRLREHDELKSIASALNNMAESLAARERTLNESLKNRISVAKDDVAKSSSPDKVHVILAILEKDIQGILQESPGMSGDAGGETSASKTPDAEVKQKDPTRELLYR